jgi:hypothetical protein
MGNINKTYALLLILIIAMSCLTLLTVKPTSAQTIPKPSAPEFTVKYVDRSYDTLPTYDVDQYTGKTVITKPSEHVDNRTIEIKIKNQPFTPFTDQNGNNINLLYNVRYKGSFGQEWTSLFGERSEWANSGTIDPYRAYGYPTQNPDDQYTTISFTLYWNMVEGEMDIQVEALVGYTTRAPDPAREHILWTVYIYTFYGEESGWSNTQTVTLGAPVYTFSPSPSPSSDPTNPMNLTPTITTSPSDPIVLPLSTLVTVIAVFLAIIVVLVLLLFRRHRKTTYLKQ